MKKASKVSKKTEIEVQAEEINFNFSKKICAQSFIFLPQNFEEKKLGALYLLGQVNCKTKDYSYILNLFASLLKKEFFSWRQKIVKPLPPQNTAALCFKNALKKINQVIDDLVLKPQGERLKDFHFGAMALCGNALFFSTIGQIKIFLFRHGALMEITALKKRISDKRELRYLMFQDLAQGEIEPEDKIILGAPGLSKIITKKGLQELAQNSLETICESLEKLIREIKEPLLCLLLLRFYLKDTSLLKEGSLFSGFQKKYITPPIDLEEIFRK